MFDLAVNGGGLFTVSYGKEGLLPSRRKVDVPWQGYVWVPDVAMIPLDTHTTVVDLSGSEPFQVAMGSVVTDDDGARQAILMFPQGTTAEMLLPDGTTQPLNTLSIRATEYTVGDIGPMTMPAELPPTTGYTYAVELSADEALENGAKINGRDVLLSQPARFYVDNFLNFPVGRIVPVGYYDNDNAAWVPYDNGRVLGIVGETGGFADVDVDGDGLADTGEALEELNITDAERERLASLYDPGRSLWRAQIVHLSTWDCNWPYGPPPGSPKPTVPPPPPPPYPPDPEPCKKLLSSTIECQSQTLGESVPVTGTPFTLNYKSDRVPGRSDAYTIEIPISEAVVPEGLLRIELEIVVAGRKSEETFPPDPNQTYDFTWDCQDAYGRKLQGIQEVSVKVGYAYEAFYYENAATYWEDINAFGLPGDTITGDRARQEFIVWQNWQADINTWDATGQSLGAWTLDAHHVYDGFGRVLHLGDGSSRSAETYFKVITTTAGSKLYGHGFYGDGGPATNARLHGPRDVAAGPDGSLYIADTLNHRIRRVDPDGIITTVAGNGLWWDPSGDGGPATEAILDSPWGVSIGPDGSLYIAETGHNRIRRVKPDGIISTVAGNGTYGFAGDGGPATDAELRYPLGVAIDLDGNIYIADQGNARIRRVGLDGIITTVAGNGTYGFAGDGGPAIDAQLTYPFAVALGPDGSLYIADKSNCRIRRVDPDGIITTVAGNGDFGFGGDGGLATDAQLTNPEGIAIGPDNSIYIADTGNQRIRWVRPDGIITTVAGNGTYGLSGDNGSAVFAQLANPAGVATGPDGSIYIANGNHLVRQVTIPAPLYGMTADIQIPSEDGSELYLFYLNGRHLQTLSAFTGAVLYDFGYDSNGRLIEIVDGSGNKTTVERDGAGSPTAIKAPGGQTTELVVNADGYLESIANPAGEAITLSYGNKGLLASYTDPKGNSNQYTYDSLGRLILDEDAAGGSDTLSRTDDDTGYTVTMTTAMGRTSTYRMEYLSTGDGRNVVVDPVGAQTEVFSGTDGKSTITHPDGTVVTMGYGPDPRFGMLSPVLETLTVETPGGKKSDTTQTRFVEMADPNDMLSLVTLEDTVTTNGRTSTYEYDAATQRFTATTPEGRRTISDTDTLGRVIRVDFETGVDPITRSYDAQGRMTQTAQGAQSWDYAYDTLNRLASRTSAQGDSLLFSYDDADRLVQLELPGGETVGSVYDLNGNRTQVIMPNTETHTLGYTARDFPASYTPPDNPGGFIRTYDPDKALVSLTLPSGKMVSNSFDATTGQWENTIYPEATVAFGYDGCGCQLTDITRTPSGAGTAQGISYGYDGKLVDGQTWSGLAIGDYQYDYDNNFFLANLTLTSGSDTVQTTFARDDDGMVTGYGPFTLTREGPGGALSQVEDAALTMTFDYDTLARGKSRSYTVDGIPVYGFDLTRDNVGRIVQKIETVGGVCTVCDYAYDANGQLTSVTRDGSVVVESYTYDANGNRLSTKTASATFDTQDRIVEQGSVGYGFDVDGFLAQRGVDSFQYSARGELLSAVIDSEIVTYDYDGLGRRVGRTDPSGTTQYLYGYPESLFLVTDVRDPAGVLTTLYYDDDGFLFAMDRGGSMYYIGTDQVGTPHVVADSTGTIVKVLEYDSFGILINDSNTGFDLPIGFAGGLEDAATRLVRFGHRDYDQISGRWTARDPALYDGGQANLYAYSGNDPVSQRDPTGLWCVGASGYMGLGGGCEVCCRDGKCSLCCELGAGAGNDVSLGSGGAKDNEAFTEGELGVGCGPLEGGVKCKYDTCGNLDCNFKFGVGPWGVDSEGGVKFTRRNVFSHSDDIKPELKCKPQAKLATVFCQNIEY